MHSPAIPRIPGTLAHLAVTGSHAQGLATASSDIDRAGWFAAPTLDVAGLHPVQGTVVSTDPDMTLHEAGKLVRLVLAVNPTVIELVAAPAEFTTPLAVEITEALARLLSRSRVQAAYGGYAERQLKMIEGPHPVSSRRGAKHARHAFRLLEFGTRLLTDGVVQVAVADRDWYCEVLPALDQDTVVALIRDRVGAFDDLDVDASPLPDAGDEAWAADWLRRVRIAYLGPLQ